MEEHVRLSKDEKVIEFKRMETLPTTAKKFRNSWELEGFYRFVFENDLRKEAFEVVNRVFKERKAGVRPKPGK